MIPAGTWERIVKLLIRKGLVREHKIKIGKGRGGTSQLLEITEEGCNAINMQKKHYTRGGGFMHDYWVDKIHQKIKSSYGDELKIEIENNIKGKFIDITASTENMIEAFEIELSDANIESNIKRDFEIAEINHLTIICAEEKVFEKAGEILKKFSEDIQGKTKIVMANTLAEGREWKGGGNGGDN